MKAVKVKTNSGNIFFKSLLLYYQFKKELSDCTIIVIKITHFIIILVS